MFISTIIPTIGRPSLEKAVESVLGQELDVPFEVIVVNDSGEPLPAAAWQARPGVRVLQSNRCSKVLARNAGAAQASGSYLHFLDDDDWLFPGAFRALRATAERRPEACCVYGSGLMVDGSGAALGELDLGKDGNCFAQLVGGSWIQLGQAITRREVFARIGGLDRRFPIGEENHFFRLAAHGGMFAHTPEKVVQILRGAGWRTSVDYDRATEFDRLSRSICLDLPGAFARLVDSAGTAYWYGRVFKAYLGDGVRKIRAGRLLAGLGRGAAAGLCLVRSGMQVLRSDFRQALRDDHVPCSQPAILGNAFDDGSDKPPLEDVAK